MGPLQTIAPGPAQAIVLTLAWLLPEALSLSSQQGAALRASLIVPAITALFLPADAFAAAGKAVSAVSNPKPSGTPGSSVDKPAA